MFAFTHIVGESKPATAVMVTPKTLAFVLNMSTNYWFLR
jgi:hypothetical protein